MTFTPDPARNYASEYQMCYVYGPNEKGLYGIQFAVPQPTKERFEACHMTAEHAQRVADDLNRAVKTSNFMTWIVAVCDEDPYPYITRNPLVSLVERPDGKWLCCWAQQLMRHGASLRYWLWLYAVMQSPKVHDLEVHTDLASYEADWHLRMQDVGS